MLDPEVDGDKGAGLVTLVYRLLKLGTLKLGGGGDKARSAVD